MVSLLLAGGAGSLGFADLAVARPEKPAAAERQSSRPEHRPEARSEGRSEPRSEHRSESRPEPRRSAPDRSRDDDDRRVVGFGSDTPAFLFKK